MLNVHESVAVFGNYFYLKASELTVFTKNVSRKNSVFVCLSVGHTSGVCISVSKNVKTERMKSIIWVSV
jgi:hypothetical protein